MPTPPRSDDAGASHDGSPTTPTTTTTRHETINTVGVGGATATTVAAAASLVSSRPSTVSSPAVAQEGVEEDDEEDTTISIPIDGDVSSLFEALVAVMNEEQVDDLARDERQKLMKTKVAGKTHGGFSSSSTSTDTKRPPRAFKMTSLHGTFGDTVIMATCDAAHGTWRAVAKADPASASSSAAATTAAAEAAAAATDAADVHMGRSTSWLSSPESILREMARSRRKLQSEADEAPSRSADSVMVDEETGFVGTARDNAGATDGDVAFGEAAPRAGDLDAVLLPPGAYQVSGDGDGGTGDEERAADDLAPVPLRRGLNWNAVRPGAVRVRGEYGGDRGVEEDGFEELAPRPRPAPALAAADRSGEMLLEANLVVEPQRVEAKPIRRRRQIMVVAGLMLLAAVVVAVPLAVILTRPAPPLTPDYRFATVASKAADFNKSLPSKTMDAINDGPSPQASAYEWLFGVDDHPELPEDEALARMIHRFALATIFYATGGNETWRVTTGWLEKTEHECVWNGVACSNQTADQVAFCQRDLHLSNSVSCRLPNGSVIDSIDLAGKGLSRQLPEEMGLLQSASLRRLILQGNDLTGSIPSALYDLSTLRVLLLRQNEVTGSLPSYLQNLTNLESLDLSANLMSGTIPTEIGLLTALRELVVGNEQLDGPMPSQLAELTNMVKLDLSGGRLSGSIPTELARLTNLKHLDLSLSGLSGTIPTEIGRLVKLEFLSLQESSSTGSIPTEIGHLRSLITWSTSYVGLTGPLPTEFGLCSALQKFQSAGNGHNGTIPTELGNLRSTVTWDTSRNALSGGIPTELGLLTDLEEFTVYANAHTGSIPTEVGYLTRLSTFDASGNLLVGRLPTELGSNTRLTRLDLGNNQLSGGIPIELWRLENLVGLGLSRNQLTGGLSTELGMLTNLAGLSLERNALTGRIPSEMYNLFALTGLGLGDNLFEGSSIPSTLERCSNLKFLYMPNAGLSGTIPTELGRLNLDSADMGANQLSGTIPTELGLWDKAQLIILGHNQLSGTIPTELAQLTMLSTLRLLGNNLNGTIPSQLAGMSALRVLRLEGNQIVGSVPTEFCSKMVCTYDDDFTCGALSTPFVNVTIDCTLIDCICENGGNCTCVGPPPSTVPWYDDDNNS